MLSDQPVICIITQCLLIPLYNGYQFLCFIIFRIRCYIENKCMKDIAYFSSLQQKHLLKRHDCSSQIINWSTLFISPTTFQQQLSNNNNDFPTTGKSLISLLRRNTSVKVFPQSFLVVQLALFVPGLKSQFAQSCLLLPFGQTSGHKSRICYTCKQGINSLLVNLAFLLGK